MSNYVRLLKKAHKRTKNNFGVVKKINSMILYECKAFSMAKFNK